MRDSQHGPFGILALILSLGLRAAALSAIGEPIHAGLALVAAHAASRAALPMTMRLLRAARQDGLGALAGTPSLTVALVAAAIGIAIGLAALGPARGAAPLVVGAAPAAPPPRLPPPPTPLPPPPSPPPP